MRPDPPLVSIVIPTYNSAEFLQEAIDSALIQTHPSLEILINDDGSTDATGAICAAAAAADTRVRYSTNPRNLGPAGNFRRCVELARGEFVKFLIPDDLLDHDAVERLLRPLREHGDATLATSRRRLVDRQRQPLPDVPSSAALADADTIFDGRALADQVLESGLNLIGEPSTVLFRRSAVAPAEAFTYAGRSYRVISDVSLWLTLCERGRVAYVARPATSFRRHRDQDQRSVRLVLRGAAEWAIITEAGCRRGLLRDPAQRRRARLNARAAVVRDAVRRLLSSRND